ncbi:interferon-gamma-inducible GTPase 10-like isoform X1 [Mobula birostris]|uniref:interferon-gamma-inducible GTPase 10-like isoform X1 n=2 Tax=Mobula birostris TaxID=1983395 RepID=UPI003B281F9B
MLPHPLESLQQFVFCSRFQRLQTLNNKRFALSLSTDSRPSALDRDFMISSSEFFSMEELERLKSNYNAGGLEAVIPEIKNKLDDLVNAQLTIAVAGGKRSGKSTFIAAMAGFEMHEEGRDSSEKTDEEPIIYAHPILPNVHIEELPGIDSDTSPLSEYLETVDVGKYDLFIIVSECRFKGGKGTLAKAVQQEGKQLYFVQSKIDNDLHPLEMDGMTLNTELQKIRMDCVANLEEMGVTTPAVYLISSFHRNNYDFPALKDMLANSLYNVKKAAFLLSLPNVTSELIEEKRKMLEKRIWVTAALAGAVGTVPLPGMSFATGIGLLGAGLVYLWHHRDLRDKCMQRLADSSGKPLALLRSEIRSPGKTTRALIKIALGVTAVVCTIAEIKFDITPLIVSVFGAVSSFCFTALLLKDSLNQHVKTAQVAVKTAFETDQKLQMI